MLNNHGGNNRTEPEIVTLGYEVGESWYFILKNPPKINANGGQYMMIDLTITIYDPDEIMIHSCRVYLTYMVTSDDNYSIQTICDLSGGKGSTAGRGSTIDITFKNKKYSIGASMNIEEEIDTYKIIVAFPTKVPIVKTPVNTFSITIEDGTLNDEPLTKEHVKTIRFGSLVTYSYYHK